MISTATSVVATTPAIAATSTAPTVSTSSHIIRDIKKKTDPEPG